MDACRQRTASAVSRPGVGMNPWPITAHEIDGEEIPMQRIAVDLSLVFEEGTVFADTLPPLLPGQYLMREGVKLLTA